MRGFSKNVHSFNPVISFDIHIMQDICISACQLTKNDIIGIDKRTNVSARSREQQFISIYRWWLQIMHIRLGDWNVESMI